MKNLIFIVGILLISGFTTSAQNIFRTACQGNLNRMDSLLQSTSINIQDENGRSLLHWAIICNKNEIFNYLIEHGIDLNLEDHNDETPIYLSMHFENNKAFNSLSNLKAIENCSEKCKTKLIEKAILTNNELYVKEVIESGLDINTQNSRGSTPIEIAYRMGAKNIYNLLFSLGADTSYIRKITLKGNYMEEFNSESEPKIFASNFISTEESQFGSIFNSTGTEFYYGVNVNGRYEIRFSKMVDNEWIKPETILAHQVYGYNDPFLSNDENRLYFISNRAMDGIGEPKDIDIWYVEKKEEKWSQPINAGQNINTDANEYYISFTNSGTMYFSSNRNAKKNNQRTDYDIFYSEYNNGSFREPTVLDSVINTKGYEADVFIAPNESYMIFCSTRKGGFGKGDLYISFRKSNLEWEVPINMGKEINTNQYEYCPFVSKSGEYLFFTRKDDIYRVSSEIISKLKNQSR